MVKDKQKARNKRRPKGRGVDLCRNKNKGQARVEPDDLCF
jgi:hypothetical protein